MVGKVGVLEVRYDYEMLREQQVLAQWQARRPEVWAYHELLPLEDSGQAVSLCEGGTPLIRLELTGPGRIWVKDETRNPTGAHKDRFHSVSISMARRLGLRKVVAATTGNHGTSAAAYCAKAGLAALIFCDPRAPRVLRDMIQFYGGHVAVLDSRQRFLERMVRELGWYPSTGLTPDPVGTPYGVEGYKSIAYEIYFQLGGRFPSRLIVPVASGDIFYGPWKGFLELQRLGADARGPPPQMFVAQSSGCDPIVRAIGARATKVPVHPHPHTIALSIGDATAAAITLDTAYESNGDGQAVSDEEIVAAVRLLAGVGLAAEPSGAAGVAAALALQRAGRIGAGEDVVCIMTGSAVKWPETLRLGMTPQELIEEDPAIIGAWLSAVDAAIENRQGAPQPIPTLPD
jgi:threonine synthase